MHHSSLTFTSLSSISLMDKVSDFRMLQVQVLPWLQGDELLFEGFLGDPSSKEPTCNAGAAGNLGSILGSVKPPGGGNGSPLQYSCLETCMDRGTWWAIVHGVAESQT